MRDDVLPFHQPDIGRDDIEAVVAVLRSGWLTRGPLVSRFEEEFGQAVGAKHAVAVSSCTAALHLALEALAIGPGDEVIVPSMTFTATAAVVVHLGATPVLVDSAPGDLCIDPDAVSRAITPRTRAIVPVHLAGVACDLDTLSAVAAPHDIPIVEDAAHAFPTKYRGRPIGSISTATCFSFYATKTLATGEGGMLTTDDELIAKRARQMSLHGLDADAWRRYSGEGSWYYEVTAPGFKYNMTDIAAALGLEQLKRAAAARDLRCNIAEKYSEALKDVDAIELPVDAPRSESSWHLYIIRLKVDRLRIGRAEFINELRDRKIGASVHFIPLHLHPFYRDRYGLSPHDFPVASREFERIISLPIYPTLSERDVDDVVLAIKDVVTEFSR